MLNNQPNLPGQDQHPVSQKLILPGVHSENPQQPGAYTQRVFVHPDQLRPQVSSTSTNPLSKLGAFWRADPAYKVLIIATSMVLIAGLIFATFLFNTFAQSSTPTTSTPKVTAPVAKVPTASKAPANLPPTFPTPSGGQGSNQSSSQPPKSAPVVLPTLTPSDANQQSTQSQNLQLQITDAPQQQVRNNSDVQITVMANQPGISVQLHVAFDNSIVTNTAGPQQTDNNGNVTLNWHVSNVSFKQNFVARITAFATDQNGQQASSQTISVDVSNRPGF